MKNVLLFIWEIGKIVLIALLIVIPIRYFLFEPFFVRGASMEPNFQSGDYLIVDRISYRFREPQRGEVIVFRHPHNPAQRHIKRIIGLPGETVEIENGKVIIFSNSKDQVLNELNYLSFGIQTPGDIRVFLDEDQYFVLGDNRVASADSRRWGPLVQEYIVGRVFFRPWPITAFAKIEAPTYPTNY